MNGSKYPLKWGIRYRNRVYMEVYGKKKAHDLLFVLGLCVQGLSVVPVKAEHKLRSRLSVPPADYHKHWRTKNRDKVREYQREYRSKRRDK
jgi:hypothetical protein